MYEWQCDKGVEEKVVTWLWKEVHVCKWVSEWVSEWVRRQDNMTVSVKELVSQGKSDLSVRYSVWVLECVSAWVCVRERECVCVCECVSVWVSDLRSSLLYTCEAATGGRSSAYTSSRSSGHAHILTPSLPHSLTHSLSVSPHLTFSVRSCTALHCTTRAMNSKSCEIMNIKRWRGSK